MVQSRSQAGIGLPKKETIELAGRPIDISDERERPIYTFGLIKPHAYFRRREIVADIYSMSGGKLHLIYEAEHEMDEEWARLHYREHAGKPFFQELIAMITGPSYKFLVAGEDAINQFRQLLGPTDSGKAAPNTLRGRYGEPEKGLAFNAIHGSDGLSSFVSEVRLHFTHRELDALGEQFWKRFNLYEKWANEQKESRIKPFFQI